MLFQKVESDFITVSLILYVVFDCLQEQLKVQGVTTEHENVLLWKCSLSYNRYKQICEV